MLRVISKENVIISELDLLEEDHDFFVDCKHSSLDDFFSLFGKSFCLLPEKYLRVSSLLGINELDRINIAPKKIIKESIANISAEIKQVLSDEENVFYLHNYLKIRSFLDSMHAVRVDSARLKKLIENQKHVGVKTNLSTFENPEPARYSMANSVTGRLSVSSGPKILTSPQEVKSTFKSRYKNGKVLQIDLSCAEPNFALFAANKEPIQDLYSFCAKDVLQDKVDRSTAKLVLLSALYGQSIKNLSANIPDGIDAGSVAKDVRSFLSVSDLQEKLRSKWSSGNLRNHLGRPLKSSHQRLLISHYLQSSVAEASILMFRSFCAEHEVTPVFVIHDALIIDCRSEVADSILGVKDFYLTYKNEKFPASVTLLG